MIQKNRILITVIVGIIIIGLFLFIYNGNKKEMVMDEGLLNPSEIDYLEVVGIENESLIKIADADDIERIILLLQQSNGSVEIDHPLADKPLFSLHIALKGHYPSAAILIYPDTVFHGKGRNVSVDLVDELVETIKSSF